MERRKALMQIGMTLGYTLAAPSFMSVLNSCKEQKTPTWTPSFFTPEQGIVLMAIVDSILPKTETLSASEVNVHIFLDSFANEVMPEKQGEQFKDAIVRLGEDALTNTKKSNVSELTSEDMAPTVLEALTENSNGIPFVRNIRDLTIWGYKCTEYVGEELLAYDSIPGQYIPCGDLDELTGGKAWSI